MVRAIRNIILFTLILFVNPMLFSQQYQSVVNLNGNWKFTIGDQSEWAHSSYDDTDWENINVPSSWENEGFNGYDGYAWYRKQFRIVEETKGKSYYLLLGNIDDVDEVFFNDVKIGQTGNFPPHFSTAYQSNRKYHVPFHLLKSTNTIAVRVYDHLGQGGIVMGDIRLVRDPNAIPLDIDLQGSWKFKLGRNAHTNLSNIENWNDIIVPSYWEDQGYKNYDGYACYVLDFRVDNDQLSDKMILLLGKIDDIDQVYLNGELIGQSGDFTPLTVQQNSNYYQQQRTYYLPENILKKGSTNRLIVRVYDAIQGGGIYSGPVGLISQNKYINYWRKKRWKRIKKS